MSRKKIEDQKPAKEKQFSTNPFAALKGVVVESARPVEPESIKPVIKTVPERSELDLFQQAMQGVQRLEASPAVKKRQTQGTAVQPRKQLGEAHKALPRDEVAARKTFLKEVERLQLDVRFEDNLPDDELRPLNGNRLRQLKRGIVELDRQLDLHGLTREEALEAILPFIESARMAGEKGVLLITGKGTHSADGPVLQQVVAGWLRDQGREMVAEYAPAPQELGGSGAFVIFLRPLDNSAKK